MKYSLHIHGVYTILNITKTSSFYFAPLIKPRIQFETSKLNYESLILQSWLKNG